MMAEKVNGAYSDITETLNGFWTTQFIGNDMSLVAIAQQTRGVDPMLF